MKLPFPRSFKAWLVALVSLTAVTVVSIAPMMRPRAQSPITTYEIIDLGALDGPESKAFSINSCGQVAGYATFGGSSKRPFFRPSNSLINLGVLSGDGIATSVNNSGFVVGRSPADGATDRAFIWHDDNGNNANDPGEMKELLPVGATGVAEDINDNGRVVGWISDDGDGGNTGGYAGFIWENNTFQLLAPGVSIQPFGINNAGTIVGVNSDSACAFVLRSGVFTPISSNRSVAYAVSEANPGHVVGTVALGLSDYPTHAFIWTDADGLKDLGSLSGRTNSTAYNVAIVDGSVQVVGTSYNALSDARAFVWEDANADGDGDGPEDAGEMKYLWDLIPVAEQGNWTVLQQAHSINSSGQIVGFGIRNGETHAFLLTPTGGGRLSPCLPNVSVSVSPAAVNEDGADSLTYTFTRSITTGSPLVVYFSTSGTADPNGSDYGISSVGSVTILENQQSATVTVDPSADSAAEQNETVILTISPDAAAYTIAAAPLNAATGTINNEDTNVSVSVAPSSVTEDGTDNLVYTFTRTGLTNAITVNFSLTGSTATLDSDYSQSGDASSFTSSGGTINFGSGETVKQITVNPTADTIDEMDETVILTVTSGTGYTAGSPSAQTGTITDNDDPPTISINNVTAAEGNTAPSTFVFTVSLSNPSSSQITVNYATDTTGATATGGANCEAGIDFINKSSPGLIFLAGETSKPVEVMVCGDNDVEPDETFFVNLSGNSSNSNLPGSTKGTGTITNDDTNVVVTLAPASVTEDGTPNLVYTFTRTGVMTGALTVHFSVGGTAVFGDDYTQTGAPTYSASAGTVTLSAGSSFATVTLDPTADTTDEPDETVILTITADAAYTIAAAPQNTATGTITDDDLPTVTIGVSPSATAEDGATNLVYTFTRAGVMTNPLTVNFSVGGTAGFSTDYTQSDATSFTPPTGTVTFAGGSPTATVTVNPTADTTNEPDETVILTLTADAAYTVGSSSSATGTITNDDAPTVQLAQSTFTVTEDSPVATITVTRSGDASSAATVKYSTSDLAGLQSCTIANTMASERCDYTTAVGRITFAPGETSKTFTVPIVNDVWAEGTETFFVTLSNPVGTSLGSQATSTVEIVDNEFVNGTSNPIFGVEYFIRALYRDILNRQPDSTGLQNWIDTLTPCPNGGFGEPPTSNCDRLHIAAGFFQSDEYLNRGYWAFRFYMVSFNQRPTYAQFIPDLSEVGGPKSPAEEEAAKVAYADAFVQKPEFLANYSGLSGQALADALTQKTGLPPFNAGGLTNGQILRGIAERPTSVDKFLTEGTVSILYFGFQRRDPDAIGYQNNVDTLNANPNNLRHMIFIFIYSTEYLNRFGP